MAEPPCGRIRRIRLKTPALRRCFKLLVYAAYTAKSRLRRGLKQPGNGRVFGACAPWCIRRSQPKARGIGIKWAKQISHRGWRARCSRSHTKRRLARRGNRGGGLFVGICDIEADCREDRDSAVQRLKSRNESLGETKTLIGDWLICKIRKAGPRGSGPACLAMRRVAASSRALYALRSALGRALPQSACHRDPLR